MKVSLIAFWLVLFLSGCAGKPGVQRQLPPLPPAMTAKKTQQSLLMPGMVQFEPAAILDVLIPWRYSVPGTNYWWSLEESTNLVDWVVIGSRLTGELVVTNRGGMRFYRLRGTK